MSSIVSHIVVGQPELSADILHNCDMITEQPCGVEVPQIAKDNGQSESSSVLSDECTGMEQQSEPADIYPVARQLKISNTLPESEANTELLSRDWFANTNDELPTRETLANTETGSCINLPSPLTDYFRSMCVDINGDDVIYTAKQLFYSLNLVKQECHRIEEAKRRH